ncbi:uncharacterized protein LOC117931828 isoform X2 [Vitis riparia]|uniref:uncharacterized protein LOC117931828 isoform X2 n=1 Tax=Vitis riparia TaxID=96939 RepID=UPI00155AE48C|nr:uncharacterized protein LOC117931828 isoform X2 [Vitis riparia]
MALPEEQEKLKEELLNHAMKGKWGVFVAMYKQNPWVRTAKLTRSGETALHIAVFQSTESTVESLVTCVDEENKAQAEESSAALAISPLIITDDRGNTPLHLAALLGKVGMCMSIAGNNDKLVGFRNAAGETPLFLAALRGQKEAFLYLHSICNRAGTSNFNARRADGETILHVAISGEYFDLAYHIICKYDHLIGCVNENGYTPLHILAGKPAVFATSLHLGPLSRFIYNCLHVEKLTNERVPVDYKGKMKPDEKYPENYKTCINFFQPLPKMLHNMIKRPVTRRENSPMSQKHMQANDANYCEDPEERYDDTRENQGKRSSNIEAQERPQLFPPNYHTSIMIILTILGLIVRLIVWVFGLRDKRKKMLAKKEKNIWSVQIMDLMLRKSSHHNYNISSKGGDPGSSHDFPEYLREEIDEGKSMFSRTSLKGRETPSVKGRETPIILAAKNGITEMVEQILEIFPSDILDTDSVGKNIVLLAVEYRQTKLY